MAGLSNSHEENYNSEMQNMPYADLTSLEFVDPAFWTFDQNTNSLSIPSSVINQEPNYYATHQNNLEFEIPIPGEYFGETESVFANHNNSDQNSQTLSSQKFTAFATPINAAPVNVAKPSLQHLQSSLRQAEKELLIAGKEAWDLTAYKLKLEQLAATLNEDLDKEQRTYEYLQKRGVGLEGSKQHNHQINLLCQQAKVDSVRRAFSSLDERLQIIRSECDLLIENRNTKRAQVKKLKQKIEQINQPGNSNGKVSK